MRKHKPFSPDKIKTWKKPKQNSNILAKTEDWKSEILKINRTPPYRPSYLIPTQVALHALGLTNLAFPHIFLHSLFSPIFSPTSFHLTTFSSRLSPRAHRFSPVPTALSQPQWVCPHAAHATLTLTCHCTHAGGGAGGQNTAPLS